MKLVPYITASDYHYHGHRPLEPNTKTEIGEGLELNDDYLEALHCSSCYGVTGIEILFLQWWWSGEIFADDDDEVEPLWVTDSFDSSKWTLKKLSFELRI
jgi:hypothetical protein